MAEILSGIVIEKVEPEDGSEPEIENIESIDNEEIVEEVIVEAESMPFFYLLHLFDVSNKANRYDIELLRVIQRREIEELVVEPFLAEHTKITKNENLVKMCYIKSLNKC